MLYKGEKGVSDEARPPEGGPAEAMEHWSSGTDARRDTGKPLHEAEIFQYWLCLRNTTSFITGSHVVRATIQQNVIFFLHDSSAPFILHRILLILFVYVHDSPASQCFLRACYSWWRRSIHSQMAGAINCNNWAWTDYYFVRCHKKVIAKWISLHNNFVYIEQST